MLTYNGAYDCAPQDRDACGRCQLPPAQPTSAPIAGICAPGAYIDIDVPYVCTQSYPGNCQTKRWRLYYVPNPGPNDGHGAPGTVEFCSNQAEVGFRTCQWRQASSVAGCSLAGDPAPADPAPAPTAPPSSPPPADECPAFNTFIACQNGPHYDARGCQDGCIEKPACPAFNTLVACKYGQHIDENGCFDGCLPAPAPSASPSQCPLYQTNVYCPYGRLKVNGCDAGCAPPPTANPPPPPPTTPVLCPIALLNVQCPYGRAKDANNCDTNTCNPAPPGGPTTPICDHETALYCWNGYRINPQTGCHAGCLDAAVPVATSPGQPAVGQTTVCPLFRAACPNGFQVDANGCRTACAPQAVYSTGGAGAALQGGAVLRQTKFGLDY
jgi:hypothetical protein